MATNIDLGNQEITFDYKHPTKGRDFNTLFRGVIKPGIYKGGALSVSDSDTALIAPFTAVLNSDTERTVRAITTTSVSIDVSSLESVIIGTYEWDDVEDNYVKFDTRAYGDSPVYNEIVFGRGLFSGSTLVGFDYSERTYGLIDENYNLYVNAIHADGDLYLSGNADFETISVQSTVELTDLIVTNEAQIDTLIVTGGETLTVLGNSYLSGNVEVGFGSSFTVNSGDVSINGDLDVTGLVSAGTLEITDLASLTITGSGLDCTGDSVFHDNVIFEDSVTYQSGVSFEDPVSNSVWQESKVYLANQEIIRGNSKFLCKTTHTSTSVFANDWLTSEFWVALSDAPGDCKDCPRSTPPPGWLSRDGSTLGKTGSAADYTGDQYRDLYEFIGNTWGGTKDWDNANIINLPDDRGLFERGSGQHGSMTKADGNPFDGGNVGDQENDKMFGHRHANSIGVFSLTYNGAGGTITMSNTDGGNANPFIADPITDGVHGPPRSDDETSPAWSTKLKIIKY